MNLIAPPQFALSKNEMPLQFKHDSIVPRGYHVIIDLLEPISEGDILTIIADVYNPDALQFEFRDNAPANSVRFINTNTSNLPFADYISAVVVPFLQAQRMLVAFFTVASQVGAGGQIELILMRRNGDATRFDASFVIQSGNFVATGYAADPPVMPCKAVYEIFIRKIGAGAAVFDLIYQGDLLLVELITTIYIENILNAQFAKKQIETVWDGVSEPFQRMNTTLEYFVRARDVDENAEWQYVAPCIVLYGGIPAPTYTEWGFFWRVISGPGRSLAMQPIPMYGTSREAWVDIAREQPFYVDILNMSYTSRPVTIEITTTDVNDNQNVQTINLNGGIPAFNVWAYCVSPAALDLPLDTMFYRIVIKYGTVLWRILYFNIVDTIETDRFIQWFNAFGFPQILRVSGYVAQGIETQGVSISDGRMKTALTNSFEYNRTYRTGLLNPYQQILLNDLMIAKNCFEISKEGYIPMQISENSKPLYDTQKRLQGYELKCIPTLEYRNFGVEDLQFGLSNEYFLKIPFRLR